MFDQNVIYVSVQNFGDLRHKINSLNMVNKSLVSLDVKSLYTNIPVKMFQMYRCIEIHP